MKLALIACDLMVGNPKLAEMGLNEQLRDIRQSPLADKGWPGIGNYKFLAALLLGSMVVLYCLFR